MTARTFVVDDWKSLTKKIETLNPLQKTIIMSGVLYKIDGVVNKIIFKVIDTKLNTKILKR